MSHPVVRLPLERRIRLARLPKTYRRSRLFDSNEQLARLAGDVVQRAYWGALKRR